MEFVVDHNDVKPFSEVIITEPEFLTSKCGEQGYPILFSEVPDMVCNVKVLEESRAN